MLWGEWLQAVNCAKNDAFSIRKAKGMAADSIFYVGNILRHHWAGRVGQKIAGLPVVPLSSVGHPDLHFQTLFPEVSTFLDVGVPAEHPNQRGSLVPMMWTSICEQGIPGCSYFSSCLCYDTCWNARWNAGWERSEHPLPGQEDLRGQARMHLGAETQSLGLQGFCL